MNEMKGRNWVILLCGCLVCVCAWMVCQKENERGECEREKWWSGGGRVNGWTSQRTKEEQRRHRHRQMRIEWKREKEREKKCWLVCCWLFSLFVCFWKSDLMSFLSPFLSVHISSSDTATFFTLFSFLLVLYYTFCAFCVLIQTCTCIGTQTHTGLTYVAHKTKHDPFRTETDKICAVLWNAHSQFSERSHGHTLSRVLAHINVQTYIQSTSLFVYISFAYSIVPSLTQARSHAHIHAVVWDLCMDTDRHGYKCTHTQAPNTEMSRMDLDARSNTIQYPCISQRRRRRRQQRLYFSLLHTRTQHHSIRVHREIGDACERNTRSECLCFGCFISFLSVVSFRLSYSQLFSAHRCLWSLWCRLSLMVCCCFFSFTLCQKNTPAFTVGENYMV